MRNSSASPELIQLGLANSNRFNLEGTVSQISYRGRFTAKLLRMALNEYRPVYNPGYVPTTDTLSTEILSVKHKVSITYQIRRKI